MAPTFDGLGTHETGCDRFNIEKQRIPDANVPIIGQKERSGFLGAYWFELTILAITVLAALIASQFALFLGSLLKK